MVMSAWDRSDHTEACSREVVRPVASLDDGNEDCCWMRLQKEFKEAALGSRTDGLVEKWLHLGLWRSCWRRCSKVGVVGPRGMAGATA